MTAIREEVRALCTKQNISAALLAKDARDRKIGLRERYLWDASPGAGLLEAQVF